MLNKLSPGYNWRVVHDPTRTGDHPGIFYDGHFRWSDIVPPCRETIACPWPNGMVFENQKTGERVVIQITIQAEDRENPTCKKQQPTKSKSICRSLSHRGRHVQSGCWTGNGPCGDGEATI